MPQALATKNGHSQPFALLNSEWDKLDLNSKHYSENQFADEVNTDEHPISTADWVETG